jgi:hypothetical protein
VSVRPAIERPESVLEDRLRTAREIFPELSNELLDTSCSARRALSTETLLIWRLVTSESRGTWIPHFYSQFGLFTGTVHSQCILEHHTIPAT